MDKGILKSIFFRLKKLVRQMFFASSRVNIMLKTLNRALLIQQHL